MYYFLRTISIITKLFPRSLLLKLGKYLGIFAYYIFPIRKKVALKNISIAFKEHSLQYHMKILKKTYMHFGMILMDFLRTPHINNKHINQITKLDLKSRNMLNSYNGIILMTGHIGSWEMILPILGSHNYLFSVVTQRQKNNSSDKFFNWVRSFKNISLIPKGANVNAMKQVIIDGEILGLASDQNAGLHGIEIPFFGENVSMPKGAGIFHSKTNAPILVGFCILLDDLRYHLTIEEVIIDNKSNVIYNINKQFNKMLEENIIKYPEQYFWFHRRFPRSIYH